MRLVGWIVSLAIAFCLGSAPAMAERLQFDHRLYPPLKAVLDSGRTEMIVFDNSNPARLVDFIAVQGRSASDWTEALEIVSIVRPKTVKSAHDWFELLRSQSQARCRATFTPIAHDAQSITYERHSPDCPAERAETGIYRLVAGKRSWFMLSVLSKARMDEAARQQWLALLASAHLD